MVLGIYGYGCLGREMAELARQINLSTPRWNQIVYIDDSQTVQAETPELVLGFEQFAGLYSCENCEVVIAIGEPGIRDILFHKLKNNGYKLATLIHPNSVMAQDIQVGEGSIICCNTFLSLNVKIGPNVLVQPLAAVGHDTQVGANSVVSSFASLAGHCSVGETSYIGMNVPIKQGISIGSHTIVGMGSVVLRDVPDGVVAVGNPARVIKNNEDGRVFK